MDLGDLYVLKAKAKALISEREGDRAILESKIKRLETAKSKLVVIEGELFLEGFNNSSLANNHPWEGERHNEHLLKVQEFASQFDKYYNNVGSLEEDIGKAIRNLESEVTSLNSTLKASNDWLKEIERAIKNFGK